MSPLLMCLFESFGIFLNRLLKYSFIFLPHIGYYAPVTIGAIVASFAWVVVAVYGVALA
jgi:hypothetical protein